MTAENPQPNMSAATKDVLARVQRLIPPMLEHFHKGSLTPELWKLEKSLTMM